MSFADITSYHDILNILLRFHSTAYIILFLGAFLETLVPFSFFIYGEFFFLAGAVLAGMGALEFKFVASALYAGGIMGDNCSYWIGTYCGSTLFDRLSSWKLTRNYLGRNIQKKGLKFFSHHGASAIFFARLCGPFSWFVPALAGSFSVQYRTFLFFNTAGVMIGIGEFLCIGYLFGNQIDTILAWIKQRGHLPLILILAVLSILLAHRLFLQQKREES